MPLIGEINLLKQFMSLFKLRKKVDPIVPTIGLGLSILGLVMILSASQITAAESYGDSYYFFNRQLISWVIGILAFFYFSKVKLDKLFDARMTILIVSIVGLVLVFFPVIGGQVNGVYRWVGIGPISFQPSELVKLALIIYFAGLFAVKGKKVENFTYGVLPFALVLGLVMALIALGKDLGAVVIIATMSMAMFFVAKARISHFLLIAAAGVMLAGAMIVFEPYRFERLSSFMGISEQSADPRGGGWHSQQALIAVGSGGIWGRGFGQGISKYRYLPEAQTDSIFAVMAEELGFARVVLVLAAFLILAWRGFIIASQANSRFAQLVAIGISVLIITQTLINIGGMLKIIPLSGVPLPFISYGGSSLIISLALLGLLTNVSRERE